MKIELIDGEMPTRAHEDDAGLDIKSAEDVILRMGECRAVRAGFKMQLEKGHEAQIRPRSGIAAKYMVTVLNAPGTIDTGYRGEVKVLLANMGPQEFHIKKGDRIAQMVIAKFEAPEIKEGKVLTNTTRKEGGFGSTGK